MSELRLVADSLTGWWAEFSECDRYRYALGRRWSGGPQCTFLMLNPSTATEVKNDPTITRCINYAKAWGHGSLVVLNLFAFRATDPREMKRQADPVGPANDTVLRRERANSSTIVCAWGVHGAYRERDLSVIRMLMRLGSAQSMFCLGLTKDKHPKHPLYLRKDAQPIPFRGRDRDHIFPVVVDGSIEYASRVGEVSGESAVQSESEGGG